jgi:hypothetical protein
MAVLDTLSTPTPHAQIRGRLKVNPFLHVGSDRIYDVLTDRLLLEDGPGYAALRDVLGLTRSIDSLGPEERSQLMADGWLVPEEADLSSRFLLKFVSIEAHTVCNQACYFCPVSIAPRADHFMPMELYQRIVRQLSAYRATIEGVFMISYNEPTADPRWVEQVRVITEAGLPAATLTNGTGLTPKRVDQILELGGLRFLSVNLSTLDRRRYEHDRGADHLEIVLRNLDYAGDKALAPDMDIAVLGTGDEVHRADFEAIRERFAGSRFTVKSYEVNDRAGYLQIGRSANHADRELCGCDHWGSRPLQHLHVTPKGKCILCCQDYDELVEVGDLNTQTVHEVLTGPEMSRMRRWVYGIEKAPKGFICYQCKFALSWRKRVGAELASALPGE